jgi:hypothetical protein
VLVYPASRIFTALHCVVYSVSRIYCCAMSSVFCLKNMFPTAVRYVVHPALRIFTAVRCVGISCFKDICCCALYSTVYSAARIFTLV